MTLTLNNGPLASRSGTPANYRIEGPAHRLLFDEFPRRVRAELGGETVFDTRRGQLLHESQMLPVLYVPAADVRDELLERSEHTTHCPFKGDASYWSVRANGALAEDAAWTYEQPFEQAQWLRGYLAFYLDRLDALYDEDERVHGHLRDPYHRVDVRDSSRRVRITVDGEPIASSERPKLLSENGLPNRYYLPPDDVDAELIASETRSQCPYKGEASYWSVEVGGRRIDDVAFSYQQPLDDARRAQGHLCFLHDELETELDGA